MNKNNSSVLIQSRRKFIRGSAIGLAACLTPFSCFGFPYPFDWSKKFQFDVIVIGAGAAGLAAAVEAADAGASVVVLEAAPKIGGNTLISGGFYSAVDSKRQAQQGVEDSEDLFFEQTFTFGGEHADQVLVRHLVKHATEGLEWLEKLGQHFKPEVFELYGAHWTRSHIPVLPLGYGYIRTLSGAALSRGVQIKVEHLVKDFTVKNGRVTGVLVETEGRRHEFKADKGVIIASGSFAANTELVKQFAPRLSDLTTNNTSYSTGEVMMAAQKIGAQLVDMEYIQCLPGCPKGKKYRVRFHNDVSSFIFLDHDGKRFIREDAPRDELRDSVIALPQGYAYTLIDGVGFKKAGILVQKEAVLALEGGEAWRADTVGELAKKLGMQPEILEKTVEEYNEGVISFNDRLGKKITPQTLEIKKPPFWAAYAGMTLHYTEGGLKINKKAQVLDKENKPIKGLYAAGTVTGGIHGKNRLGGNGLADAIVFGRTAGQQVVLNNNSKE